IHSLVDPEDLPRPRSEFRGALLPVVRGTEDQPVAFQGVDRQEGLPRILAEGIRPVDRLGHPSGIELEGSLDCDGAVGQSHDIRVVYEGRGGFPTELVNNIRQAILFAGDLLPGALELLELFRYGIGSGLRVGLRHCCRFRGRLGSTTRSRRTSVESRRLRSESPRTTSEVGNWFVSIISMGGSVNEAWDILPSSNLIVGGANGAPKGSALSMRSTSPRPKDLQCFFHRRRA